jgi:poly(A) polymerase
MAETLPPADWTKRADLAGLVGALGPGNARYVGGAVRDTLLGIAVKDIDLATPLLPQVVIGRLDAAGIRSVPTGLEHGTVTAVLPEGAVEITTLRQDLATDGRRATVAFAMDWRADAARRDFTINALYADPATAKVFDYFGGLEDLAAHRVRFIGDARERIREDHLRILRYFRFQARFGSQPPDQESENACAELAGMLKGLSRERIGMELLNLLGLPDPALTLVRMKQLGVLNMILPEADPAGLARLVAEERRQGVNPDAIRRLAALLPPEPALAEQVAARFRLSGTQKKRLVGAASRVGGPKNARALAYHLGREEAIDWLLLDGAEVSPLAGWDIPKFPLKGGAIVARGVTAGPEVARVLLMIEAHWVAEGFPDAERVQALLDQALG